MIWIAVAVAWLAILVFVLALCKVAAQADSASSRASVGTPAEDPDGRWHQALLERLRTQNAILLELIDDAERRSARLEHLQAIARTSVGGDRS